MSDFNLIVHGFVIIDEVSASEWDICVPDIAAHACMYGQVKTLGDGSAQSCSVSHLKHMPKGHATLAIPGYTPTGGVALRDLVSFSFELVLHKKTVKRTGQKERTVLRVPRPSAVRSFRGFEVPADRPVIKNPGHRKHAFGTGDPRLMYETTVLRYQGLPDGTKLEIWKWAGQTDPTVALNLNLYSQSPTSDGKPGGVMPGPHGNEVNEMLTFAGGCPSLHLASISKCDGAHDTAIGIRRCELANLKELYEDVDLAEGFVCGRGWMGEP